MAPPAREALLLFWSMAVPCHGPGRGASTRPACSGAGRPVPQRDLVNGLFTSHPLAARTVSHSGTALVWLSATHEKGPGLEEIFYIADRDSIDRADELIREFGMLAVDEAAARSRHYRELGNAIRFCEWRQIERFLSVLALDMAVGTVH